MTTNNFPPAIVGWVAIATGVSAILAVIFLIVMATANPAFGKLNDIFNSVIGISSLVLAWMLYTEYHARSPLMSQVGLCLAVVGLLLTLVGSVLIIFGFTDFVLAGLYTGLGNALIGLWLVAFCTSMQRGETLPHSLVIFGFIVGAFMAVGLIGIRGILAGIDSMESMPWYLYIAFLGFLGTYILYPIWTNWLGRILLSKY